MIIFHVMPILCVAIKVSGHWSSMEEQKVNEVGSRSAEELFPNVQAFFQKSWDNVKNKKQNVWMTCKLLKQFLYLSNWK